MYGKKTIDSYYFTTKGFYIFFIPVKVPYKQIYSMADKAGLKKKEAFGPILEVGKLFGFGWIGVEVEKPVKERADVVHVSDTFDTYEHVGPFKNLGKSCKKISAEMPGKTPRYFLYLDDPDKVSQDKLRTLILFK